MTQIRSGVARARLRLRSVTAAVLRQLRAVTAASASSRTRSASSCAFPASRPRASRPTTCGARPRSPRACCGGSGVENVALLDVAGRAALRLRRLAARARARPPCSSTATTTSCRRGRPRSGRARRSFPSRRRAGSTGAAPPTTRAASWPGSPRPSAYLERRGPLPGQPALPDRGRGGVGLGQPAARS